MASSTLPYPVAEFVAAARRHGVPLDPDHADPPTSPAATFTDAAGTRRVRLDYGSTNVGCVVVTGTPMGADGPACRRDLSWAKAPTGRVFLSVELPMLPAFLLAARARDVSLVGRLSVEDPWVALKHASRRDTAWVDWHEPGSRAKTKDVFFTFVTGRPVGHLAQDPHWADHPALDTFTTTFARSDAWLNSGRSRFEQWKLLNASAFAVHAELTGAALSVAAHLPGNATPVHVEASLPVLEVDADHQDEAMTALDEHLLEHLRSMYKIPSASEARPRLWISSNDRLADVDID